MDGGRHIICGGICFAAYFTTEVVFWLQENGPQFHMTPAQRHETLVSYDDENRNWLVDGKRRGKLDDVRNTRFRKQFARSTLQGPVILR
jgi:hypothetical protein